MGLVEDLINLQVVQWLNTGSCLDDGIISSLYVFLVLSIWNYSTEMPSLSLLWPSLGMTEKSRIEQNNHFLIEDIINSITKQKEEGKDEAVKKLKLFLCLSLINPLLWLTKIYLWRLWLCYNRKKTTWNWEWVCTWCVGEQVVSIVQNNAAEGTFTALQLDRSGKSMTKVFGVFHSNIQHWKKDWVKMSIRSLVCSQADK